MFQCEVVSIGGTYTDPLSIHTAMTILNLLRLFWSYVLMGIPRSPFIGFPLRFLLSLQGSLHVYFGHIDLFRFECPPLAFIVLFYRLSITGLLRSMQHVADVI